MEEAIVPVLFWAVLLVPIGIFISQLRRVRAGTQSGGKGIVGFFSFAMIPVLSYVLMFFALIGIEEVTKIAIVGEGMSRSVVLVAAIGVSEVVVLTVPVAIVASVMRRIGA